MRREILSDRINLTRQIYFLRSLPKTSSDWRHNDQRVVEMRREARRVVNSTVSYRTLSLINRVGTCGIHRPSILTIGREPRPLFAMNQIGGYPAESREGDWTCPAQRLRSGRVMFSKGTVRRFGIERCPSEPSSSRSAGPSAADRGCVPQTS